MEMRQLQSPLTASAPAPTPPYGNACLKGGPGLEGTIASADMINILSAAHRESVNTADGKIYSSSRNR
jgi:hypothetical protein